MATNPSSQPVVQQPPVEMLEECDVSLQVAYRMRDAFEVVAQETHVNQQRFDAEILSLCDAVEHEMTSCLAIPKLAPFVNTEGVASLIQGHRHTLKQSTASPLNHLLGLWSGRVALANHPEPMDSPPDCVCPMCQQRQTMIEQQWSKLEELCSPMTVAKMRSAAPTAPALDRQKLSYTMSRGVRSNCLCLTPEAKEHRALIDSNLAEVCSTVSKQLTSMGSVCASALEYRRHLAETNSSRVEELRRLQTWYQECLLANVRWEEEQLRRQQARAALQDKVNELHKFVAEEEQQRIAFCKQFGRYLPSEGFPEVTSPPTPLAEVAQRQRLSILAQQQSAQS